MIISPPLRRQPPPVPSDHPGTGLARPIGRSPRPDGRRHKVPL